MKKKGGEAALSTNSPLYSTFDITVGSVQQSLYVTIDGNYTFVIIELDDTIYALTLGWFGDYYLLSGFSLVNSKMTYSGDKLNDSSKTIVLTTDGGGAKRITDNNLRQKLNGWKQFEYIKSAAPIATINLALNAADPNAPGCVIS